MMIRSSCSEPLKKTVLVGAYNWRMYILILIRWAIRISQVCDLHWSHLLETTTASHDVSFLLSFSDHELYELLVVDGTIAINISLSDHLIDFLVSEFLTQICHYVAQLSS